MSSVVADTHAAPGTCSIHQNCLHRALQRMSAAVDAGEIVLVPSICVVELLYLYEKGRIPADDWKKLGEGLAAEDSGLRVMPLTLEPGQRAGARSCQYGKPSSPGTETSSSISGQWMP